MSEYTYVTSYIHTHTHSQYHPILYINCFMEWKIATFFIYATDCRFRIFQQYEKTTNIYIHLTKKVLFFLQNILRSYQLDIHDKLKCFDKSLYTFTDKNLGHTVRFVFVKETALHIQKWQFQSLGYIFHLRAINTPKQSKQKMIVLKPHSFHEDPRNTIFLQYTICTEVPFYEAKVKTYKGHINSVGTTGRTMVYRYKLLRSQ